MIDQDDLKRTILDACVEDHVGLWEMVRLVERQATDAEPAYIRTIALDVLQDLLSAGKIEAGFPAKDGLGFEPWKVPVTAIMATLRKDWTPERPPTIGEIAWFTTPEPLRQTA